MSIYTDCDYPVADFISDVHERQLENLEQPGTWGTSAQRIAVVAKARQSGIDAGVLEGADDNLPGTEFELSKNVQRMIELLAVSPKDFTETDFEEAKSEGLSDEEYTEIVGLVSRLVSIDVFARALGVKLRPLPEPGSGSPTRQRPETAVQELAFVPTIPNGAAGGELGRELYGGVPKPYIIRSLSLVPDEMRRHLEMEQVYYLPLKRIIDYDYQHHEGLNRVQVEVVAGRISAINECFY